MVGTAPSRSFCPTITQTLFVDVRIGYFGQLEGASGVRSEGVVDSGGLFILGDD